MKFPSVPGIHFLLGLGFSLVLAAPFPAVGQEVGPAVRDAYFRALAEHFEVPLSEVAVVSDWGLVPDEVPVVLFLAKHAGVSPDALVGLRRSGQDWRTVASRFGLSVRSFHIALPRGAELGSLTRAYSEFNGRPPREWNQIELTDPEIIALVNLRVLSEAAGVPPLQVLESRESAGSFLAGFPSLGTPSGSN